MIAHEIHLQLARETASNVLEAEYHFARAWAAIDDSDDGSQRLRCIELLARVLFPAVLPRLPSMTATEASTALESLRRSILLVADWCVALGDSEADMPKRVAHLIADLGNVFVPNA